ncbi:MAG TPA: hypothetical protein VGT02_04810 [Methylomirabilota bacterium]|nr:hypothetical protein [Methylomirabilota bacterium]
MGAGARRAALVTAVACSVVLAGCAGRHLRDGVYRSEHGFRVTVPGPGWQVVNGSRAELELRRADGAGGMLAHATCRPDAARRDYGLLERHLLLGLRDRATLEADETDLAGRRAAHRVVEGRPRDGEERMRIESFMLKDDRCVYDLLYVAPAATFDGGREDFRRFVSSFVME